MIADDPLILLADGALAWNASRRARVAVTGADARAFLHRLSTNHVAELVEGQGRLNAFLTDKGRLVDLVLHLDRGAAGLLLIGSEGRGSDLCAWLDRFLFTEKVELVECSAKGGCVGLAGARAPVLVEGLVIGAAALAPWSFVERGGRVIARDFDRVTHTGARVPAFVIIDLEGASALEELVAAGAVQVERDDAEALRVAAGIPGEAGELVDAHTPLDLALHDAIHWAKGCYIGQEVIARLDSYAKVGKQLVGLVLDAASLTKIATGARVLHEAKPVGVVTSVSPRHNGALPSALAVIAAGERGQLQLADAQTSIAAQAVDRCASQAPQS